MAKKILLRHLVDDYLAWLGNRTTATTTRHHLKTILDKFGGWQPHRIGPAQVQAYLTEQRGQGRSDATCIHRAKILRTILAWGVRMGKAKANLLTTLRLPTPKSRRIAPPTLEEVWRMCKYAAPHVQRVLLIGVACGPRIGPSELLSLRWEDVDLVQCVIHMPNANKGVKEDSRLVPIRDTMVTQFQEWRTADGDCPWVINYHGKQVKHIDHAWHKARIAAGITRRITPYSLRHAFATEALEHGADINAVAQIMGHSDPTMILKVYQHIRLHKLREAVNLIPDPTGGK